jgi:hypothetical protein
MSRSALSIPVQIATVLSTPAPNSEPPKSQTQTASSITCGEPAYQLCTSLMGLGIRAIRLSGAHLDVGERLGSILQRRFLVLGSVAASMTL